MSLCKSEIERVHKVLSLMLKNLECPICLELMKEPISTKCDHQFCRFCILKLFGKKKGTIQCPLCNNTLTKRSLHESTRFKQLTEGIMKTIDAFELDTGYEFSVDNASKTPVEVNTYKQLWQDDGSVQNKNTPQKVVATGVSKNRTLKVCSDPPLTEFVRRVSPRNKRQKIEVTPVYVEIDSDSSEEPLFRTHLNVKSTLQQKIVNKKATSQKEKVDRCDNDEKPFEGKKSKLLSKPVLEELFSSEMDDNEVSEDTANTDAGDYSCATESETEQKQMTENKSESSFCSPEAPDKLPESPVDNANESSLQVTAERVNRQNCVDGNKLFTDSETSFSERNTLKKVMDIVGNPEELHQKDSTWIVRDETDFQRTGNQPNYSSVVKVSKRKSQRIIKKVSEWLSKINVDDVATLGVEFNPYVQNTESDSLAERESHASDEEASSSDDTEKVEYDLPPSPLKDRDVTNATDVKNKIFGITYKRDKRKSAPVNWSFNSDSKSDDLTFHREDVFISCIKTQKGKTRSSRLGPEDFIKRNANDEDNNDTGVQNGNYQKMHIPLSKNIETETNKKIIDEPSDGKQNDKLVITTLTKLAICSDTVEAGHYLVEDSKQNVQQPDLELRKTDVESKKKLNKGFGKKGKKTSVKQTKKRTKPLQLVNQLARADGSPRSSLTDMNENKIDSFPSSEEPVKMELEMRTTRRSSRLKLLDEELIMQDKKIGKKSKLIRLHSHLKPGADIAPLAEPSEENTDAGMVCVQTESLPLQDIIVQVCNGQLPNVNYTNQDNVAFHGSLGNCVAEELEDSAALKLSEDVQKQLRDCDKTADTESAAVPAECPLCPDRSSFIVASVTQSVGSGSQTSLLLLAPLPVPGKQHSDLQVHSSCTEKGEVNPNGTTCLPVSHSRVGTVNSEENSSEELSIKQQTRSKEETEDSEVDTELLLKSFKLSKRRSFILLPAAGHRPAEDGCPTAPASKCVDDVSAGQSKISRGAAVNRECDGNFAYQKTGKVNLDKTGSRIEDAEDANDVKSKQCTFELDNELQLLNRTDRDSVEIVPPTASTLGSPLPLVFPQHIQQVAPLSSSRMKGKRLLRRKGSNSSCSVVTTEKETFDSDRSSQTTASAHINSNTNNNSWLKATNAVQDKALKVAIGQEVQQDILDTGLESNAHPESELLFSTGGQLGQEATEKDIYQEKKSDKFLKEIKFYKDSELPQKVPTVVESITESELVKLTGAARYYSQPMFTNAQGSITVGNTTSENKCPLNSQMSSITPSGLLGSAEESINKSNTKTMMDELDEVQSQDEMREGKERLKQYEEVEELKKRSLQNSSTRDLVRGRRKRPVKLSTSESETSDEELPCFQIFGFNKSGSNVPSVSQSPLSTTRLSLKGSLVQTFSLPNSNTEVKTTSCAKVNKLEENVDEGSLKIEYLSPSQESEESPDLFSSHSDGSSPGASPHPKLSNKTHCKQTNALIAIESENRDEKKGGKVEETWEGTPARYLQPQHLEGGKVPGYDSEASHTGDSFSPESELLNTQQRYAMQNNIKKLEHEMAVLEAALDQHGSQDTEHSLSTSHQEDCPELLEHQEKTDSSLMEKVTAAFHPGHTENLQSRSKSKCLLATEPIRPQPQLNTSITFTHGDKEEIKCPKPLSSLMDLEISRIPERFQAVDALNQFQSKAGSQGEMTGSPSAAQKKEEIKEQINSENEGNVDAGDLLRDITWTQKLESTGKRDCVLAPARSPSILSSMVGCQPAQRAESPSMSPPQHEKTDRRATSKSFKQNRSSLALSPVFNKSSNSTPNRNAVVTIQRKMSFVASGLNKHEIQLVETFARKTGATFLNNFSPSTTHVIMKTDTDLVCERTLKYFMGIAGRRWVVSYQWIIECFREGTVIDEHEFEVQGDVINGRNHKGPRKARKTADAKLLLSHYEVCCFGSFTGMSRDQLEWMVELCGASITKEPYLFTYSPNCSAVVVVQPDANPVNTDYRAIQRQYNTIVVTREWILDSVARYQNHQLEAYLVCLQH